MSRLKQELMELKFPNLEDTSEQAFGEATWENALDMVRALIGHGYTLARRNKVKVGFKKLKTAAWCWFGAALSPFVRTGHAAHPVMESTIGRRPTCTRS